MNRTPWPVVQIGSGALPADCVAAIARLGADQATPAASCEGELTCAAARRTSVISALRHGRRALDEAVEAEADIHGESDYTCWNKETLGRLSSLGPEVARPFFPRNHVGRAWGMRCGAMAAVRLP